MSGLIWFWPGVVVSAIAGLVLAAPAARALRTRAAVAWLLIASFGVIVAATLTPIHGPGGVDASQLRPCDFARRWFATPADITAITDVGLNIALFIPFGFAIALLPWSRRTLLIVVAAFALPIVIESLQYGLPGLARGCQSGDVIDNLTGLMVGLVVGAVVGRLGSKLHWMTSR